MRQIDWDNDRTDLGLSGASNTRHSGDESSAPRQPALSFACQRHACYLMDAAGKPRAMVSVNIASRQLTISAMEQGHWLVAEHWTLLAEGNWVDRQGKKNIRL